VPVHALPPGGVRRSGASDLVTPQGVLAEARIPATALDGSLGAALAHDFVVVLVAVGDPGNAGTILRSAEAAGAGAVVFGAGSVDPFGPKCVRASGGSVFRLDVVNGGDPVEVLQRIGTSGRRRLAAVPRDGRPCDEVDATGPVALVLGSEAHGLPAEVLAAVDERVVVPMAGRVESLNVAMAGTVVCFEVARQRRLASAGVHGAARPEPEPSGAEVVSTVSHELRSPLTSVKGYTSLLLNRWDRLRDDQKKMMLEQIQHDADRVTRLIGELLDISRLETGRLTLRRQMVDLPVLAANVVAKVGIGYPELECELSFPPDFPAVYADADKLEQVLTNLVENAAKYASPVGLQVRGEHDEGSVEVAVTDHGEGIPPDDLPHVFRKFFRRDQGKPSGTGLGLWISRGLVEAHGGHLTAESTLGAGSTFRFTLPRTTVDDLLEGI
jgi:signal transduction histidine kinase